MLNNKYNTSINIINAQAINDIIFSVKNVSCDQSLVRYERSLMTPETHIVFVCAFKNFFLLKICSGSCLCSLFAQNFIQNVILKVIQKVIVKRPFFKATNIRNGYVESQDNLK